MGGFMIKGDDLHHPDHRVPGTDAVRSGPGAGLHDDHGHPADADDATPKYQLVQAKGRGSQGAAQTKDDRAKQVHPGVSVLLSKARRKEDRASQHQEADDHQPRRLGHIDVEIAGNGGNRQGDGDTG